MGDESPKNKVKFLCSYGGKILPRPSDGLLRYVGGETRVVSVPRHTTFSEVMKKVSSMVEGEMVLKYQLVPEDLDALVSVRTEEDVKHMIEEHDRHQTGSGGLLRAFLFPPSRPGLVASEPYLLEQRYIDAINGVIRTSPRSPPKGQGQVWSASACSSPKSSSPEQSPRYGIVYTNTKSMQRVQSSPSLTNLGGLDSQYHNHNHNHHHRHPAPHHPSSSPSRPPQDPQLGGRKTDYRGGPINYYYSTSTTNNRQQLQRGYAYLDVPMERIHSMPRSPRRKSIWE